MDALTRLDAVRDALSAVKLPLPLADAKEQAAAARAAVLQIDDYLRPRLLDLEAPLLAVIGGPTGAGKSSVVNAIVGAEVVVPGVIRPTTRRPTLVHNPADLDWFLSAKRLPGMPRVRSAAPGDLGDAASGELLLVAAPGVPAGLALIDAPDIDSVADANRALARQLLAAADLWVFVTSANRYADAVQWAVLDQAAAAGTAVMVVLNRIPPGEKELLVRELGQMLEARGLSGVPVFGILESADGIGDQAGELRANLYALAEDRLARIRVIATTLAGAAAGLARRVTDIAAAVDRQREWVAEARQQVSETYREARGEVAAATSDGALLRGEVLARWQDFVGTSDAFRRFEAWVARSRDSVTAWLRGKPAPAVAVAETIQDGLHAVLAEAARAASDRAWKQLHGDAAGRDLLSGHAQLRTLSPEFDVAAARLIRSWQGDLLHLVQDNAGSKRARARILSFGLNAVTVALMIVVFASTGGLTGGELVIAGGSAVIGQKLLETLFGEDAVRRLAIRARDDLAARVGELMDREAARYYAVLDAVPALDTESLRADARVLATEVANTVAAAE